MCRHSFCFNLFNALRLGEIEAFGHRSTNCIFSHSAVINHNLRYCRVILKQAVYSVTFVVVKVLRLRRATPTRTHANISKTRAGRCMTLQRSAHCDGLRVRNAWMNITRAQVKPVYNDQGWNSRTLL